MAKYYFEQYGDADAVREKLESFLLACSPEASLVKWGRTLDRAVAHASAEELVQIDYIPVTQDELDCICVLDSIRCQRLAFTLLCLAKYTDEVRGLSGWVDGGDGSIIKLANVNITTRQRDRYYHDMYLKGLIQPSGKVDSSMVKVLFIDNGGHPAMKIDDFRNLGYQFQEYMGGDFYHCANCGIVVPVRNTRGRPAKYCSDCAAKIRIRQSVDSVMRRRISEEEKRES